MGAIGDPKTGGRTAGTRNRRTWEARQLAEFRKFDPLDKLIDIIEDPDTTPSDRIRALSYTLGYLYPKLSNTTVTVSTEGTWTECLREVNERRMQSQLDPSNGSNGSTGHNGNGNT